ncbi:hypothetical protein [Acinetobacter sp. A47]|nr:hypothetical protein [Acinetobacter sp. A47]
MSDILFFMAGHTSNQKPDLEPVGGTTTNLMITPGPQQSTSRIAVY